MALRVDGAPLFDGQAAQVFLSNLPYFGFGFHVDPVADPTDGRLEAIVLRGGDATRRRADAGRRPRRARISSAPA